MRTDGHINLADVHTTQLGDSTSSLDALNCTCATGATATKWRYRNANPTPDPRWVWPVTAGLVRALCREEDGSWDHDGGTNLYQVQAAVQRGWKVPMAVMTGGYFDAAWDFAKEPGVLVVMQFQYSVLHGTRWEASRTFMGPHAGVIANADEDECDFSDPLADGRVLGSWHAPNGVQRMERHILREACGRLVVNPKTGQTRGLGRSNASVTRVVPLPPLPPDPADTGDTMFNIGPSATYRDAVLKAGTILYRDATLTIRHSHVANQTPLGFLGSTSTAHVVVNSGNTNYVRRADVTDIVENERHYE
jgi:hypothetical protein